MAPEQDPKKRPVRKLTKKRKLPRASSVQYPERLKLGEDVHEDVTATKGMPPQQMNQSVFSMITAAGSKVDFHARFENESSDSEGEHEPPTHPHDFHMHNADVQHVGNADEISNEWFAGQKPGKQTGQLREQRALRSLPELNLRTIKEKNYMSESSGMPFPEFPFSVSSPTSVTPRDAPVMSRMLAAQAQLGTSGEGLSVEDTEIDLAGQQLESIKEHGNLAIRLKEIFSFENPEEVISGVCGCFWSPR